MIQAIGAVGVFLLSVCAVPQAVRSYRDGHSRGISGWFVSAWFFGEVLTLVFAAATGAPNLLIVNYAANIAALLVVIWYTIRPRI